MLLDNYRRSAILLSSALLLSLASGMPAFSQDSHGEGPGAPPPGAPSMERSFHGGGPGRWWDNPNVAQQVGVTDDQKKKMDDIFQQHKPQLIDLKAALEKQEAVMRPLIEADQPDEGKILSQIDSIAQARAELEKANARMLFGIRTVLTADQWKKVRAIVQNGPHRMGDDGMRRWGPRSGGSQNTPGQTGPDGGAPPPPSGPAQPNE